MRIAIDAMGGDHAPAITVRGALIAAKQWPDLELLLVGRPEAIEAHLAGARPRNLRIVPAEEVIAGDEEPVRAVRRKRQSSMVIAGRLVREGEADAMISAGNTGALMATGLLVIGRVEGVDRPALAPLLPTWDGRGVLALDLGANMDAEPEHLVQYAVMGTLYRRHVHGIDRPRVGLLNVGTEPTKGNELTKRAFSLLERSPVAFIGNVESRDVLEGQCDVLVCDGFVGNIMLKSMEGTALAILAEMKRQFSATWTTKLAALAMKHRMQEFRRKIDYRETGGAPLLGVRGVCIKAHGASDADAFKNAIRQAREALCHDIVRKISEQFREKRE